jgi:hypothetical protein
MEKKKVSDMEAKVDDSDFVKINTPTIPVKNEQELDKILDDT